MSNETKNTQDQNELYLDKEIVLESYRFDGNISLYICMKQYKQRKLGTMDGVNINVYSIWIKDNAEIIFERLFSLKDTVLVFDVYISIIDTFKSWSKRKDFTIQSFLNDLPSTNLFAYSTLYAATPIEFLINDYNKIKHEF